MFVVGKVYVWLHCRISDCNQTHRVLWHESFKVHKHGPMLDFGNAITFRAPL